MANSRDYVYNFLDFLLNKYCEGFASRYIRSSNTWNDIWIFIWVGRYPNIHFDFHGHNDYDLSVANVLEAVKSGVKGVHLTVNGMGERAGNAPLASVVAVINDFLPEVKIILKRALYTRLANLSLLLLDSGFLRINRL